MGQTQLDIHDHFKNKNHSYSSFAAIIHQGSLDGGHYTALCLRAGKWVLFNDDHITEIDQSRVIEYLKNAYVLFYSCPTDFDSQIKPDYDPREFKDLESIIKPRKTDSEDKKS